MMYRWTKRPFANIRILWNSLTWGIGNLISWFPVIWCVRGFDYYHLLWIMEVQFRSMAKSQIEGYHVRKVTIARRMRVCAELCRRVKDDRYMDNWQSVPEKQRRAFYEQCDRRRQYDLEYLCLLMKKHLFSFWD